MSLLCAVFIGVVAPEAQEFRIASDWKRGSDARDRATRIFIEEVELRAPEIKLEVISPDTLGRTPAEQFAALQSGKVELAVFPLTYGAERVPEFALPGLPGLVPGIEASKKLKGSITHRKLQSIAEANGIRILSWWWVHGGFVSTKRLITDPGSVKGLKLRGDDRQFEAMLKAAGATIEAVPAADANAALKSDRIEVFASSYETLMAAGTYESAKFATVGGWTIWNTFSPLLMSKAAWDKLTPAQREIFAAAAEVADGYFEASQRDAERRVVTRFAAGGAKVYGLSPDEWEAWVTLAQQTTWRDYVKIGPAAAALLRDTLLKIMEDDKDHGGATGPARN